MRNPAGERTDGLHLLRFAQLLLKRLSRCLGLFALGNVHVRTAHTCRLTLLVTAHHCAAIQDPTIAAISAGAVVLGVLAIIIDYRLVGPAPAR